MTTSSGASSVELSSIEHSNGRIDDNPSPTGERAVPYHCPYCAEEDLRPLGNQPGAWHCRSCLRAFSVRFLGLTPPPELERSSGLSGRDVADGEESRPVHVPDPLGGGSR